VGDGRVGCTKGLVKGGLGGKNISNWGGEIKKSDKSLQRGLEIKKKGSRKNSTKHKKFGGKRLKGKLITCHITQNQRKKIATQISFTNPIQTKRQGIATSPYRQDYVDDKEGKRGKNRLLRPTPQNNRSQRRLKGKLKSTQRKCRILRGDNPIKFTGSRESTPKKRVGRWTQRN